MNIKNNISIFFTYGTIIFMIAKYLIYLQVNVIGVSAAEKKEQYKKTIINIHKKPHEKRVINVLSIGNKDAVELVKVSDQPSEESLQIITALMLNGIIIRQEPHLVPETIKNKSYQTSLESFLTFLYKHPQVTTISPNTFSIINFPIIKQIQQQINKIKSELQQETRTQWTVSELQDYLIKHNFPRLMMITILSNNYQNESINVQEFKEKLDISILEQIPNYYMIGCRNDFKTPDCIDFDQQKDFISEYITPYCSCQTCLTYYEFYVILLIMLSFRQFIYILDDDYNASSTENFNISNVSKGWMKIKIFTYCISILFSESCMNKINLPMFYIKYPHLHECLEYFGIQSRMEIQEIKDIIFTIVLNIQTLYQLDPNNKTYNPNLTPNNQLSKVLRAQTQLVQQIQNKNNFKLLIDQKDNIFKQLHIINDN